MKLFTAEQMRSIDRYAIENIGIPSVVLMENAGTKALLSLEKILGTLKDKKITILCGKGNNAGDGFVIARHLLNNFVPVNIFLIDEPTAKDAKTNLQILRSSGFSPIYIEKNEDLKKLKIAVEFSDCVIDCLFGTGFKGEIEGVYADAISVINASSVCKVSIDMPSGVCATTGRASQVTFKADYTICLAAPKVGMFLLPGKEFVGKIFITDIGIPQLCYQAEKSTCHLLTTDFTKTFLPLRKETIHKKQAGTVVIFAGSQQYGGAPVLASYGALRSGAGVVKLYMPDCLSGRVPFNVLPEVIIKYTDSKNGVLNLNTEELNDWLKNANAVLLGPGISIDSLTQNALEQLLDSCECPLILDADALSSVAKTDDLSKTKAKLIITPHLGEFAHLTGISTKEINDDIIKIAQEFAIKHNLILVLKSAITLIAEPNANVFVASNPNSGLAKAGSGDLLSGLIAGLAATGMQPLNAALIGVSLLSDAARLTRNDLGADSMTVSEVAANIPRAFKMLRGEPPTNS